MVIKQVISEVKQNHNIKQECIPVGCTLTAAVATSRCQYQEGWVDPPFQMQSPSRCGTPFRCRHPSDADPPFRCKPQLQMQTPASDVDPTSDADLPFRCRHPSDPYTLHIQTPLQMQALASDTGLLQMQTPTSDADLFLNADLPSGDDPNFRCRPQCQMQTPL